MSLSHRMTGTPTWITWSSMRQRCTNPRLVAFKYYGGRGITVCERWSTFEAFLEDMGVRPSLEHSLDRIDVNGNYEPSNCRWATVLEQHRNRRDNKLTVEKVRVIRSRIEAGATLNSLAREYGVTSRLISQIRDNKIWR